MSLSWNDDQGEFDQRFRTDTVSKNSKQSQKLTKENSQHSEAHF